MYLLINILLLDSLLLMHFDTNIKLYNSNNNKIKIKINYIYIYITYYYFIIIIFMFFSIII